MSLFASKTAGYPAEGDGSYNEVFRGLPLSHFPAPSGPILTVPSDASISEAVSILSAGKVLAAAVRNNEAPDTAALGEKYIGVIDFNSIVHWMMVC